MHSYVTVQIKSSKLLGEFTTATTTTTTITTINVFVVTSNAALNKYAS